MGYPKITTEEDFHKFWSTKYPNKVFPNWYLRDIDEPIRFRIHSLPKSKRYSNTQEEWDILLIRQNKIISDILEEGEEFVFVTGDFYDQDTKELFPLSAVKSISDISFIELEDVQIHKIYPDNYDEDIVYKLMFSEHIWYRNKFDNVLKDIANDYLRGFFISKKYNRTVIPYDGGIDLLLEDTGTRDLFKYKYRSWLSLRPDGA